jgi:uracil-DNA glycosylase
MDAQAPGPVKSLRQLAESEAGCTRCPLYRDATQAVPDERLTAYLADGDRTATPAS